MPSTVAPSVTGGGGQKKGGGWWTNNKACDRNINSNIQGFSLTCIYSWKGGNDLDSHLLFLRVLVFYHYYLKSPIWKYNVITSQIWAKISVFMGRLECVNWAAMWWKLDYLPCYMRKSLFKTQISFCGDHVIPWSAPFKFSPLGPSTIKSAF